jgi:hypothetical protein
MSGRYSGEVPHGAAKDGLYILTAFMVSSGGRHHNQRRGHCAGRVARSFSLTGLRIVHASSTILCSLYIPRICTYCDLFL